MSRFKFVWEVCPHCETEVKLRAEFKKQDCPECGRLIKPCALCVMDIVNCNNCGLGED